jgi:hypothetical protein
MGQKDVSGRTKEIIPDPCYDSLSEIYNWQIAALETTEATAAEYAKDQRRGISTASSEEMPAQNITTYLSEMRKPQTK